MNQFGLSVPNTAAEDRYKKISTEMDCPEKTGQNLLGIALRRPCGLLPEVGEEHRGTDSREPRKRKTGLRSVASWK